MASTRNGSARDKFKTILAVACLQRFFDHLLFKKARLNNDPTGPDFVSVFIRGPKALRESKTRNFNALRPAPTHRQSWNLKI